MKYLLLICFIPLAIIMLSSDNKTTSNAMNDQIINLQYMVRQPLDTTIEAPLLVLLHGYGSNEKDLFSLANRVPSHWYVVSLRAPIVMSADHFIWYDGKIEGDNITIDMAAEEQSRKAILKFIAQFVQNHKVDQNKVVAAGFSQGGGLSLTLALLEPDKIHAAASFSGRVVEPLKILIKKNKALQSKKLFVGYGSKDPRVPLQNVEANIQWLKGFGPEVTYNTYEMGHSIVPQEIDDFIDWLKGL